MNISQDMDTGWVYSDPRNQPDFDEDAEIVQHYNYLSIWDQEIANAIDNNEIEI